MGGRLSVGGQDLICLCNGEYNKLNWPLAAIVCLFWLCVCMCVCVPQGPNEPWRMLSSPSWCRDTCALAPSRLSVWHVTEAWVSLANKVETSLPLMQLVIHGSLVMWRGVRDHVSSQMYRYPIRVGQPGVSLIPLSVSVSVCSLQLILGFYLILSLLEKSASCWLSLLLFLFMVSPLITLWKPQF